MGRTFLFSLFIFTTVVGSVPAGSKERPDVRASHHDQMRIRECRGELADLIRNGSTVDRKELAKFLSLRRKGHVPAFDRGWCLRHKILPPDYKPKRPA